MRFKKEVKSNSPLSASSSGSPFQRSTVSSGGALHSSLYLETSSTRSWSPMQSKEEPTSNRSTNMDERMRIGAERRETNKRAVQDVYEILQDLDTNMLAYSSKMSLKNQKEFKNFVEVCRYFTKLPYEEATKSALNELLKKLEYYSAFFDREMKGFNPATKVMFALSPLLRFNVEEKDLITQSRVKETLDVNHKDIASVMKKSMKWKVWGNNWLKDQHDLHEDQKKSQDSTSSKDERLLLCRICEQQIESSKMKEHNIECTRRMLIYSSNYTLRHLLKKLKEIIDIIYTTVAKRTYIEAQLDEQDLRKSYDILENILLDLQKLVDESQGPCDVENQKGTMMSLLDLCSHHDSYPIEEVDHICTRLYDAIDQRLRLLQTAAPEGLMMMREPRQVTRPSIRDFQLLKPISRGAYGRVFLARKITTGDLYAIKTMNKRELTRKNQAQHIQAERRIMSAADNPFVVKFFYSFQSRHHLYIVMEFVNGGDLFSLLKNIQVLPEEQVVSYAAEIVLALGYLHDVLNVVHRDLKPDNILITNTGHLKLTDFGLSQIGIAERHASTVTEAELSYAMNDSELVVGSYSSQTFSLMDSLSTNNDTGDTSESDGSYLDAPPLDRSSSSMSLQASGPGSLNESYFNELPPFRTSNSRSDDSMKWIDKRDAYLYRACHNRVTLYHPDIEGLNRLSSIDSDNSTPMPYFSYSNPNTRPSSPAIPTPRSHDSRGRYENSFSAQSKMMDEFYEMEEEEKSSKVVLLNEKNCMKKKSLHKRRQSTGCVGTPDYMAPELLLGQSSGPAVDWWSFGALLYELITGVPPFNDTTYEKVFDNIVHRTIVWPSIPKEMSPEAYDLINRLLEPNPEKRLGTKSTEEVKSHPFFASIDWEALNHELTEVPFIPQVDGETDTSYFVSRHPTDQLSEDFKRSMELNFRPTFGSSKHHGHHHRHSSYEDESIQPTIGSLPSYQTGSSEPRRRNRSQYLDEHELEELDIDELEHLDVEALEREMNTDPYPSYDSSNSNPPCHAYDSHSSNSCFSDDEPDSDEYEGFDYENIMSLKERNEEAYGLPATPQEFFSGTPGSLR